MPAAAIQARLADDVARLHLHERGAFLTPVGEYWKKHGRGQAIVPDFEPRDL